MVHPDVFFAAATGGATLATTGVVVDNPVLTVLGTATAIASTVLGFIVLSFERIHQARLRADAEARNEARHQDLLDFIQELRKRELARDLTRAQPANSPPVPEPAASSRADPPVAD